MEISSPRCVSKNIEVVSSPRNQFHIDIPEKEIQSPSTTRTTKKYDVEKLKTKKRFEIQSPRTPELSHYDKTSFIATPTSVLEKPIEPTPRTPVLKPPTPIQKPATPVAISPPIANERYAMERQLMQTQIDGLKMQVDTLMSSNQLSNFMLKMTKFVDVELDTRVQHLQEKCARMEAEASFYKERAQELLDEKKENETVMHSIRTEQMGLNNEFIRMQLQLSEQFQRYEDLEQELENERDNHRELYERYKSLEIEIKILENEKLFASHNQNLINELRDQLKMKNESIQTLNDEIARYRLSLVNEVEKGESMKMALRSVDKTPRETHVSSRKKLKSSTPIYSPYTDDMKENDHLSPNTPSKKKAITTSPMAFMFSKEKGLSPGKSPSGKGTPKSQKKEPRKSKSLWFRTRDSPKIRE